MEKNKKLSMPMFRRIIHIHQLIQENRYPNCKTLSQELECSEMTIHRDLNILTDEFSAPLSFDWRENGYYYTENFSIPLLETISQNEITTLKTAKKLLEAYENVPLYKKITSLLDTICSCGQGKENRLISRIAVSPTPQAKIDEKVWTIIKLSLEENRILSFNYNNCTWDPDLTPKRTVRPYQLLIENGVCYLFGFLEEKNEVRLYDLRRMTNLCILPRTFTLPSRFEFKKFIGGSLFGTFTRFSAKKYKIAFYEDAREIVRNTVWATDQEIIEDDKEDRTIITFTSSQDMKVLDWVFENKAYALPLEPPEFVEKWKFNIIAMAQSAGLI